MIKYFLVFRYSGVHSTECYKCGAYTTIIQVNVASIFEYNLSSWCKECGARHIIKCLMTSSRLQLFMKTMISNRNSIK